MFNTLDDIKPNDIIKCCAYLDANDSALNSGAAICINNKLSLCYVRNTHVIDIDDYHNIDAKKFIELRKQFVLDINNGKNNICNGCKFLVEKPFKNINLDKINYLNIANFTTCNLRCTYCYFTHEQLGVKLKKEQTLLLPIITNLSKQNVFSDNICLAIAGGEPTLFEDIHETLQFLNTKYKNFRLNLQSNFTISKNISKILPSIKQNVKGFSQLYTSVDAGTAETYKKIRGRNLFLNLKNNIMRAAKMGAFSQIVLKYMLIDENDLCNVEMKDIYGFLDFLTDVVINNKNNTILSLDRNLFKKNEALSDKCIQAAGLMEFICRYLGINILYSACGYISQQDIQRIQICASQYKECIQTKNNKSFNHLMKKIKFYKTLKNISSINKCIKYLYNIIRLSV